MANLVDPILSHARQVILSYFTQATTTATSPDAGKTTSEPTTANTKPSFQDYIASTYRPAADYKGIQPSAASLNRLAIARNSAPELQFNFGRMRAESALDRARDESLPKQVAAALNYVVDRNPQYFRT